MLGSLVEELRRCIDGLQAMARDLESGDVAWPDIRVDLVALERERERLDHTIGALVSDLEARGAAALDGCRSMAAWLTANTGQRRSITGSRLWLATRLRSMPATDAAVADGSITGSHANVLTRAQNPRTLDAFARDENTLVGVARQVTADQLVQVVEHWLRHVDPDGTEPADTRDDTFRLSTTLDGRLKGDFEFGGELAIRTKALLDEVVAQIRRRDKEARKADPTDPRLGESVSRVRARAFGEVLDRAAVSPKNPARRQPLFSIVTTLDTLTGEGDPLAWRTEVDLAWRSAIPLRLRDLWACDGHVSRTILGADREPLDVGRARRIATAAQRRALLSRHGGCAVPDCDAAPGQVEIHHHQRWTEGGLTDLDNLLPTCSWHHHRIHTGDLTAESVDGGWQFVLPDGRVLQPARAGPDAGAA
ncbi:DUF222 domain-containing protein [Actinospongicola halichondriae]|uniref:HNH endonuclease signature motif containing protein n=1 Tax=Actinospongicola halichondriae TaxID=3236844 RepID=UPI003D5AFC65